MEVDCIHTFTYNLRLVEDTDVHIEVYTFS